MNHTRPYSNGAASFGAVHPNQLLDQPSSSMRYSFPSGVGSASSSTNASTPEGRTNGAKHRKRPKTESSGDDEPDEGQSGNKKPTAKRNRAALSQPFALASEHERLKDRVAHLETYIMRSGSGDLAGFQTHISEQGHQNGNGSHTDQQADHLESPYLEDEMPDSDTEDAALVLEELALGKKLTRFGARARRRSSAVRTCSITINEEWVTHEFTLQVVSKSPITASTAPPPIISHIPAALAMPPASRAMASLLVAPLVSRRRLVFDDVWESIPSSKPLLDFLVRNYYTRADWGWHVQHKPTFMAEYDGFTDLVKQGRKDEIDPLWLASLCMVLCLSVNSLDGPVESPLVAIPENDLTTLPWKFFELAQAALECGDWTGKPRIRTLQTICLFAPFLLFAGLPSTGERHQTYVGAAVRISQQLGLHKLGHDPNHMPAEDVALPPGINSLRREIPIRIFHTLLFLDYIAIKVRTSLPPQAVDCALPGNFNDSDLSSDGISSPQPNDVATDISFEVVKFKIALQQRRFNEILGQEASFEYDVILDLDAGYREIIDTLPATLRDDFLPPMGEELYNIWRRHMCTQTIYNRLLRLHRPFMSRGLRDPKYAYSTKTAIEAARKTLLAQQHLQRAPLLKAGFQLLNVQGAVVVLFMSLWSDWPEDLIESKDHSLIRESITFFESKLMSRQVPVRKIATQSLQVIGLLFEEFEKRRTASEARKAAGGSWASDIDEESYGHLLKRIGAVVVSAASLASATPGLDTLASSLDVAAMPPSTSTFASVIESSQVSAVWNNPGSLLESMNYTTTEPTTGLGLSADFDVSSLQGPEYASSTFDWGGWTAVDQFQFATLGSF
ncbi:hypothetical protein P7C70_g1786, partial [Phenoliferia sp. Uapishka_3]